MWKVAQHLKKSSAESPVSKPDPDGLEKLSRGRKIVEKLSQLKNRCAPEAGKVSNIKEPRLPARVKMGNITLNPIPLTQGNKLLI